METPADNVTHAGLTFADIARVRVKRERVIPSGHLDWAHNRIALGESCLVIGVWGLGGEGIFEKNVVPYHRIRSFFIDERLPVDWKRPEYSLGFLQTLKLGGKLRAEMDKVLETEADAARLKEAKESQAEAAAAATAPSATANGGSAAVASAHAKGPEPSTVIVQNPRIIVKTVN